MIQNIYKLPDFKHWLYNTHTHTGSAEVLIYLYDKTISEIKNQYRVSKIEGLNTLFLLASWNRPLVSSNEVNVSLMSSSDSPSGISQIQITFYCPN